MGSTAESLITFGALLLCALVLEGFGRHTALPRVTLLILFGVVIGKSGLDLLPQNFYSWFGFIADVALLMVGFLLGGNFTPDFFKKFGKPVMWISVAVTVLTFLLVSGGLYLFGIGLVPALILGAIATATDPAAVNDVIDDSKSASLSFSKILRGVVAIDDAWGLVLFSCVLALLYIVTGNGNATESLLHGAKELFGAVFLGACLGFPMAYLSGRIKDGEPMVIEALGFVLLCGGLARYFEFSHLLSAMVMGAIVVNFAYHHTRPIHAIENIEHPFLCIFFLVAGASLHVKDLDTILYLGSLYVVMRVGSRFIGGYVGAKLAQRPPVESQWIGMALLPQAGVALGMGLVASERFSAIGQNVLAVIVATTVLFELTGPVFTRIAIDKAR